MLIERMIQLPQENSIPGIFCILLERKWLSVYTIMHVGSGTKTMLNIKTLEELEGRGGRKVRVVESIGSEWEEVAKALDMGQEDTHSGFDWCWTTRISW